MAYMIAIHTRCQNIMPTCHRPRTHRVYSRINESKGEYCRRHAEKRLDEMQATEDRSMCATLSPAEHQTAWVDSLGEKR